MQNNKPWQPSEIRRELSNSHPDLITYPQGGGIKFDDALLNSVFARTQRMIEFSCGSSAVYDRKNKLVGFVGQKSNPFEPDPANHVQYAHPAYGRYTQNSQFDEKDPLWKTRNEVAYRCFVTGCEFTFDMLFTPTGKSIAILLFEDFKPNFKKNAYGDAHDKRGLTNDIEIFMGRLQEIVNFAKNKQ
jgi:hypothetical protein